MGFCHSERINNEDTLRFSRDGEVVLENSRTYYRTTWAQTTYRMQSLRDNPECAQQEHDVKFDTEDPGLSAELTFDINEDIVAKLIAQDALKGSNPKIAILREQGVNSHVEMAAPGSRVHVTYSMTPVRIIETNTSSHGKMAHTINRVSRVDSVNEPS